MEKFQQTIADLESGKVRVAEKVNGEWQVNSWVKEVILSGFRLGKLTDMTQGQFSFFDLMKGGEEVLEDKIVYPDIAEYSTLEKLNIQLHRRHVRHPLLCQRSEN